MAEQRHEVQEQRKYGRYLYASYKGENQLGVPEGAGRFIFDLPDFGRLDSVEGVRKAYKGELADGRMKHGYLEFVDKSFYMGDFNPINNKFHGLGRFSFTEDIYYQGRWNNGQRHGFGEDHMLKGIEYTGNFSRDMKHGQGKITYVLRPG